MINESNDTQTDLKEFKYIPPTVKQGIKPYPSLNVYLTYQNSGSTWIGILRGKAADIDLVFNGLYNFMATNGSYNFFDHAKTVAIFWTDERALKRFFFNKYFFPKSENLCLPVRGKVIREAMAFAQAQLAELRANGHEVIKDFSNQFSPMVHAMGQISAERPDSDFKDSVLAHAFKDKSE